ncbi:hypothetical protein T01_14028 [Trichinella spiralis]|uniref:Uncharacterized protein n=1 Tax=Trichinella spiralis TaxID=6334 RepID=A0A0V1AMN4_TRISP|nr:hypothetical protein T01_14028 [Trichinella spiralis]
MHAAHSLNHLMQSSTKIYCSEMSKKLFPDYRTMTEERLNGLAILCTFILALALILGWQ